MAANQQQVVDDVEVPTAERDSLVLQLEASPYALNEDFVHVKHDVLERHWNEAIEIVLRGCHNNKSSFLSPSRIVLAQQWLHRLIDMHQQEGRYYHTAVHLEEILGYLDIVTSRQQHPSNHRHRSQSSSSSQVVVAAMNDDHHQWQVAVLLFAAFFHDAIYDVMSPTNEEDSATLFQTFFQDIFGDEIATVSNSNWLKKIETLVVQIIVATKRHEIPPTVSTEKKDNGDHNDDDDVSWMFATFLDLDMAVLGKQRKAYMAYASLIRREYEFVPHDDYCETRANILQDFVERGDLYLSTDLREAWETKSKDNLRAEIALLRQGIIPGEQQQQQEEATQEKVA